MAKIARNYRISSEVDQLLKAESARLSEESGKKVSEADVIELAVVAWLSGGERKYDPPPEVNTGTEDRRKRAEEAMHIAEAGHAPAAPKVHRQAESVAQRRAREAKEHAAKLAECDTSAREMGRDDIEYDLDNVPYRSILNVASPRPAPAERHHYDVLPRKVKPLNRPHGSTEAKRRREQ